MPRIRLINGIGLLAILFSAVTYAQAPSSDPCAPTAASTIEINLCGQQRLDAADHALNDAYRRLLSQLNGEPKKNVREKLIAAQRLWIRFRDAECAAEESVWAGGSVHTSMYLDCMRIHTLQRTKELDLSNWQGG